VLGAVLVQAGSGQWQKVKNETKGDGEVYSIDQPGGKGKCIFSGEETDVEVILGRLIRGWAVRFNFFTFLEEIGGVAQLLGWVDGLFRE